MDPRDFLNVADDLVTGVSEAEWRSGVSRAYYSAFHVARTLLSRCGFAVPRADQAHSYLWLRLSNTGRLDVDIAGNDLNDLRGLRNWADYDLHRPFPNRLAVGQSTTAANIIRLLDDLAVTPAVLAQVVDAIRVYERDVLREVTWRASPGQTP
jgi:uncharacterized protein (UPF0332 family)